MTNETSAKGSVKVPRLKTEISSAVADASDRKSSAEAEQFAEGKSIDELKAQAEQNELSRAEAFKDHFEWISVVALYASVFVFSLIALVWVAHLIIPTAYHWLSANQIKDLKNLLTGGVIAGAITSHLKKRL